MKRIWVAVLALMLICAMLAMSVAEGLEVIGDDYEPETDEVYESFEEEVEEEDEFLIGGDAPEQEDTFDYAESAWEGEDAEDDYAVSATEAEPKSASSDFEIKNGVLVKYKGKGGNVVIPSGVTSIGNGAFLECESLTSVTIPNSVKSIGKEAFSCCESLTSVTIPNSVTSIGESAFEACYSLESITIPNSVKSIGGNAFSVCYSLTNITIPNSVTSIGWGTFEECHGLKSITIPNSVKSIGGNAFCECYSLKSITIPNSVTSIGECAFYFCTSLTNIMIPSSVKEIGPLAFADCEKLTSVRFESSTVVFKHIDDYDDSENDEEDNIFFQGNSNLTFYCKSGSTAEAYAKKWGIKYKLTDVRTHALKKKGKNGTITAYVGTPIKLTPQFATNAKVAVKGYKSSKPKIATVNASGLVTPKQEGKTTITVTTKNKKVKATVTIKVVDPTKPTGVSIKQGKTKTLKVGEKLTLTAVLSPTGAKSGLTWKSSKPKIVSVDKNGVITAKKKGKAKITVTSTKNKKAKATITVTVTGGVTDLTFLVSKNASYAKKYLGGSWKKLSNDRPDPTLGYQNTKIGIYLGVTSDSKQLVYQIDIDKNKEYSVLGISNGMTLDAAKKILFGRGFGDYEYSGGWHEFWDGDSEFMIKTDSSNRITHIDADLREWLPGYDG